MVVQSGTYFVVSQLGARPGPGLEVFLRAVYTAGTIMSRDANDTSVT
jgi:hypothetical protein